MVSKDSIGKNRNHFFDFLKGLACIGVVFIHVPFPGLTGEIISKISQFAVPVFFMIAGYYALGCSFMTVKRRLIRISKTFVCGYFYFLAYNLLIMNKESVLLNWLKVNYTLKALAKYIIFCNIDFAIPLWYLIAMIETYVLWYFIVKSKKEDCLVKVMPVLFVVQIILTVICETNDYAWFWKINFVTRALPWFLFGYYVHGLGKGVNRIERYNVIFTLGAVAGCAVALLPVIFDIPINFSCIGILFYSISLFLIAVKYSDKTICSPIAYIGDKLSRNVYLFHVLIAGGVNAINKKIMGVDVESISFKWMEPIITVIVTIIFSWGLYIIKLNFVKTRNKI